MADFTPPPILRNPANRESFAVRFRNILGRSEPDPEPEPEPEPEPIKFIYTTNLTGSNLRLRECRLKVAYEDAERIYNQVDADDVVNFKERARFKALDAKNREYSFVVRLNEEIPEKKLQKSGALIGGWASFLRNNKPNEQDELQIWWIKNYAFLLLIKHQVQGIQKTFTVLRESDIRQRQEESISHVSDVLSISRVAASILLCNYKWNVSQLHDEWVADENRIRKSVGLLSKPVVLFPNVNELSCGICFDSYHRDLMHSVVCGHLFCTTCWKGYITTSISDGPKCLLLRCPAPDCSAAVGNDMILKLASDEDNEKYSRYLVQYYIVDKEETKWCPAPDCQYAVEFKLGSSNYDVICLCSHAFCWNCTEEAHHPLECRTVASWICKNESENMNQLCLGASSDHEESTGGYNACNRYKAAKQEGLYDEAEKSEMAKNAPERYKHYYERWASNQTSRQKAIADLHQMQTAHLEKLSDKLKEPKSQLNFIAEAWQQIIEGRRVLKWTYAYGYYLPEDETAKRLLFEHLQGEAEAALEMLHQCAEKELLVFLGNDDNEAESQPDFETFRAKLVELTRVTRSHFENLVKLLLACAADV